MTSNRDLSLISVVIPAFNEEDCVDELGRRLQSVFTKLDNYRFEVVVVENGSSDSTLEKLLKLRDSDSRFRILRLVRNVGCDNAIFAGLSKARGAASIVMTADLQDPPELIPQFLNLWEEGYENVYGVVLRRPGTPLVRRINSVLYYKIQNLLSDEKIPPNASDFRLIDRNVIDSLLDMPEHNRFFRSMVSWVGFRSIGIEFVRPDRFAGSSKADTLGVLNNAFNSILQSSQRIIRLLPIFGLLVFLVSLSLQLILVGNWFIRGVPFSGFGTIVSILLMTTGLITLLLGLIARYIWLIFVEVQGRPHYLVREFLGSQQTLSGSFSDTSSGHVRD